MVYLPDDIQWYIWKLYYSNNVVKQISENKFIWDDPSNDLVNMCKDNGAIQQGHHELHDMIYDENMVYYTHCVNGKCVNCISYGFPCLNLSVYGFENTRLAGLWNPNFDVC